MYSKIKILFCLYLQENYDSRFAYLQFQFNNSWNEESRSCQKTSNGDTLKWFYQQVDPENCFIWNLLLLEGKKSFMCMISYSSQII